MVRELVPRESAWICGKDEWLRGNRTATVVQRPVVGIGAGLVDLPMLRKTHTCRLIRGHAANVPSSIWRFPHKRNAARGLCQAKATLARHPSRQVAQNQEYPKRKFQCWLPRE